MKQGLVQGMQPTIRFSAPMAEFIVLPNDASAGQALENASFVEGTVNGFPFRASVETSKGGRRGLRLSPALQDAAGAKSGADVAVEITRIGEEPEVRMPEDLRGALESSKVAGELWQDITPMARREWVRWIASAKREETREKRIEVGIDKLTKGMRRPCCFPGLNFVTKDLVEPEETWGPLPKP